MISLQNTKCEGHGGGVVAVVSLFDDYLASGSRDKTIKIWRVSSGECVYTLKGHTDRVSSLCVNEKGKLISTSKDKTLKVMFGIDSTSIMTLASTERKTAENY